TAVLRDTTCAAKRTSAKTTEKRALSRPQFTTCAPFHGHLGGHLPKSSRGHAPQACPAAAWPMARRPRRWASRVRRYDGTCTAKLPLSGTSGAQRSEHAQERPKNGRFHVRDSRPAPEVPTFGTLGLTSFPQAGRVGVVTPA